MSTEDQETFNRRVPFLFGIPAVVHGVSMEPMLGPIKAMIPSKYLWDTPLDGKYRNPRGAPEEAKKLDWMIVGCESGAGRRPFKYDWARQIRDTCVKNDIPFYFKQAENPLSGKIVELPDLDGEVWEQYPKKYDRLSRTMMIPE